MSWVTTWNSLDVAVIWGASVLLQATLMSTITLGLASCMRRHSAMRYWLCCSGLLLIFLCPLTVLGLQRAGVGWVSVSLTTGDADSGLIGTGAPEPVTVMNAEQGGLPQTSPAAAPGASAAVASAG